MNNTKRKERPATIAARQARFRERRKAEGFRRVTVWLTPDQVDTLESFGGEQWLGTTVKEFLERAVDEYTRPPRIEPPEPIAALPDNGSDGVDTLLTTLETTPPMPSPLPYNGSDARAVLWAEADCLNKAGYTWESVARLWNSQGRRTPNNARFRGANIAREVRRWKAAAGGG